MKAILAFVIVVAIVGGVSFAKMFGVRITLPAIKKFDAAVLAVLLAACTVVAQKGTNDPPRGASAPCSEVATDNGEDAIATSNGVSRCNDGVSPSRGGIGSAVTVEDVGRMFSVVSVGTNEVFDFTMPAGATRVQKWWLRGGSNDRAFVPKGVVKIGGELLDSLRNPTNSFYPLKATSLLVAGESEFWYQQTASNSTVYTWKDAYLWRNLSLPFSMQAEVFENGDFEYRYDLSRISDMDALTNVVIGAKFGTNEMGEVSWLLDGTNNVTSIRLHRLSEFDWDGDGRANEIDPDPCTNNGDCHGQGEGWVLASFTNSAEIVAAGGYTNWVAAVVENDTDGWWYSFTNCITAIKPEMRLVNNVIRSLSGTNYVVNPCSIVVGGRHAVYEVNVEPSDYPANRIIWSCNDSDLKIVDGNPGTSIRVKCPQILNGADIGELSVRFGDCPSISPACQVAKTPVRELTLSVYQCMEAPLPVCPVSDQMLNELNDIYSQIGIRFPVVYRGALSEPKAYVVRSTDGHAAWMKDEYLSNDDGIPVVVVDKVLDANAFTDRLFGVIFLNNAFALQTLAHEIGHYLGADDVYSSSSDLDETAPEVSADGPFIDSNMEALDWNNGSGQRFYRCGLLRSTVIEQLLMYGFDSDEALDIPHGWIEGVGWNDNHDGCLNRRVDVGRRAMSEGGSVL